MVEVKRVLRAQRGRLFTTEVRARRTYHEVGYEGMIMPDHVPVIEGDTGRLQAFSYCFGYIQALLQSIQG